MMMMRGEAEVEEKVEEEEVRSYDQQGGGQAFT